MEEETVRWVARALTVTAAVMVSWDDYQSDTALRSIAGRIVMTVGTPETLRVSSQVPPARLQVAREEAELVLLSIAGVTISVRLAPEGSGPSDPDVEWVRLNAALDRLHRLSIKASEKDFPLWISTSLVLMRAAQQASGERRAQLQPIGDGPVSVDCPLPGGVILRVCAN